MQVAIHGVCAKLAVTTCPSSKRESPSWTRQAGGHRVEVALGEVVTVGHLRQSRVTACPTVSVAAGTAFLVACVRVARFTVGHHGGTCVILHEDVTASLVVWSAVWVSVLVRLIAWSCRGAQLAVQSKPRLTTHGSAGQAWLLALKLQETRKSVK